MFSRLRLPQIPPTGNDATDAGFRAIVEHFRSLENRDALAIGDVLSWTPVLTFTTPGDLNVVYSLQYGTAVKLGQVVLAQFALTTSTFTHTTAAGNLKITGLPIAATSETNYQGAGSVIWQGITSAYTQVTPLISSGASFIQLVGSQSGAAFAFITKAETPTGGTVALRGTVIYRPPS